MSRRLTGVYGNMMTLPLELLILKCQKVFGCIQIASCCNCALELRDRGVDVAAWIVVAPRCPHPNL